MDKTFLLQIMENLEDSCFPVQIDWNKEKLYLKGLEEAIEKALLDNGKMIVDCKKEID